MTVINTNVQSLIAQQALKANSRTLGKAMEQLSTGKRINSAADDAAGLAISNKMTSQVRGLNQAIRNANDGISLLQTVEGATKEITNMLQRMRELAVQSANDTYSDDDRTALQAEVDELLEEIDRINNNTTWNGMQVFDKWTADDAKFLVGMGASATAADDVISVAVEAVDTTTLTVNGLDISTHDDAVDALEDIDAALVTIDSNRATYGAKINRLMSAADNMNNIVTNISESRSRILDADYASATTELARSQIIQQAATAMLAQANQSAQSVLSLLK